jgi:prepilin-type N-terminal cleavage/methylation domain-containing protein
MKRQAFTLIELLAVIATIGILAALLLPTLSAARARSKRAVCLNNLKQINLATRMYAEDNRNAIVLPSGFINIHPDYALYKEYVKSYASYTGKPSPSEKLFACPADTFYYTWGGGAGRYHKLGFCEEPFTDYTSYAFNGGNRSAPGRAPFPGIAGRSLTSIKTPSRTLLILEAAAMAPFSWHQPQKANGNYRFPDSMNMVSYVDGHASCLKIYWDSNGHGEAWHYDPPAKYDYQWSGD